MEETEEKEAKIQYEGLVIRIMIVLQIRNGNFFFLHSTVPLHRKVNTS